MRKYSFASDGEKYVYLFEKEKGEGERSSVEGGEKSSKG